MKEPEKYKIAFKYFGFVLIVLVIYSVFSFKDSILFYLDLSGIKEKCIFCNFENRHHCHLCKSGERKCLFCINNPKSPQK